MIKNDKFAPHAPDAPKHEPLHILESGTFILGDMIGNM
jgi:hypothetical protein